MGGVVDIFTGGGGGDSDDAEKAAEIQAEWQGEALEYLKEREELPQGFREEALTSLAGLYDVEGGQGSQQDLIDRAIESPLYQSIMSGQEVGEEAIMRSAGATGGLRSGNVQGNMYDYNVQLQNRALLASYNEQLQGLTGLAGLPSNANNIATGTANIGATLGQGKLAGAQMENMQGQNQMNNLMQMAGIGLQAYQMFSDRRLKFDIVLLGQIKGFNFYSFKWNSIANALGLTGNTCGCMAEEVFDKNPKAVSLQNSFMVVDYRMIGVL